MPTKAKAENTPTSFPKTEEEWAAVIDAAPDGDSANSIDWSKAILTHGGGVDSTIAELRILRGQRGAQKMPRKVPTALRLSPEVVEFFRSTGPGWQTRVDAALREYVKTHSA